MSTALQVGLLNYHLAQVRTGGNLLAASIALYNFSGGFNRTNRRLARGVSVLAFLAVAWMLWRGAKEYRIMVDDSRDTIPEERVRSMLGGWIALSHGMAAAAVCIALFGGVYAVLSD